jgi:hypothetical protein
MSQYAGEEALRYEIETGFAQVSKMVKSYDMRRKYMFKSFNGMGLNTFEPRGAFYLFPSIKSTGLSSEEFCYRLIDEKHVACVPGTAFGAAGEGFIRCSYASSMDNLREAVKRIGEFVEECRNKSSCYRYRRYRSCQRKSSRLYKDKEAINAARGKGIIVTLAAGRIYTFMRRDGGQLYLRSPIIAANGADIRKDHVTIRNNPIPPETFGTVLDIIKPFDLYTYYSAGTTYSCW